MAKRVLVAYGSKYGATAEIAQRIGQVLERAGLAVEVKPAGQAGAPASFDAVVLGSAVYIGAWQKDAAGYLQSNAAELARKLVWLFSSGPTGEGAAGDLLSGWKFPEKLQPLADEVKPRELKVFGGKLDPGRLNLFEKLILKMVKAPAGDFRDWGQIESWAAGIAEAVREEGWE